MLTKTSFSLRTSFLGVNCPCRKTSNKVVQWNLCCSCINIIMHTLVQYQLNPLRMFLPNAPFFFVTTTTFFALFNFKLLLTLLLPFNSGTPPPFIVFYNNPFILILYFMISSLLLFFSDKRCYFLFVCWLKVVVAMSMIDPNVVHVSNVFLHECYGLHSLCVSVLWNTNSLSVFI
jgi:hypothetical protein